MVTGTLAATSSGQGRRQCPFAKHGADMQPRATHFDSFLARSDEPSFGRSKHRMEDTKANALTLAMSCMNASDDLGFFFLLQFQRA